MVLKQKSIIVIGFAVICAIAAMLFGGVFTSGDSSRWTYHADTSWYNELQPSFTIDTPEKLAGLAKLVNEDLSPDVDPDPEIVKRNVINGFAGKVFDIDTDLNLSRYLWEPIGTPEHPFKGTLYAKNGGSFTISGLKLAPGETYAGLVGYMDNATVGGLIFANNGSISLHNSWKDVYVGVAVGKMVNNSTVYNITNRLPIEVGSNNATVFAGGIVGSGDGTISNSFNEAAITANASTVYSGGIVGHSEGTRLIVKKVTNSAAVTAHGFDTTGQAFAGGIQAYAGATLVMDEEETPIENKGAISANGGGAAYAGGIVGKAQSEVSFSNKTANSGAVKVKAEAAKESYAGGLAGSIAAVQADPTFIVTFDSRGAVENVGGTRVYTGGIVGYAGTAFSWQQDFTGSVPVTATGTNGVYTGGLIGYATGDVQFRGQAKNTGSVTVTGAPDEAYSGGLIGYAGSRLLLDNTAAGSYENSGGLQVTGGTGVYTGGISGNKAYARTNETPASNVGSTGAIKVNGKANVYTGGFVGVIKDGSHYKVDGAAFASTIEVDASAATAQQPVYTGGIIGYAERLEAEGASFTGELKVVAGSNAFTGGVVGGANNAKITGSSTGNTEEDYAAIVADGTIGGIAGLLKGEVISAQADFLSLKLTSSGGVAGGIIGNAQGLISNAAVGMNADYEGKDSVRIEAGEGVDGISAGGVVGVNNGAFELASGEVSSLQLVGTSEQSNYKLGGLAGELTADAKVGKATAPVKVTDLFIEGHAANSSIGGAVGVSSATQLDVLVSGLDVQADGASQQIGGVAGANNGIQGPDTKGPVVVQSKLATTGSNASIGGVYGYNGGQALTSLSDRVAVSSQGAESKLGGIAGRHTGSIKNAKVVDSELVVNGEKAAVGGAVGLSEQLDNAAEPVIENVLVTLNEDGEYEDGADAPTLLTVTAADARAGGIVGWAKNSHILKTLLIHDFNVMIVRLDAEGAQAGGIAGRAENSTIVGDAETANIHNLQISTTGNAKKGYVGGIVGYNDQTLLDRTVGSVVTLSVNGSESIVGGMTGYNRGTQSAVIANVHVTDLGVTLSNTATGSTVGGFVGVNAARADEPTLAPSEAVSSIQKSRYTGSTRNSTSQAINVQAKDVTFGGMVGENSGFIANNGITEKVKLTLNQENGKIGGLIGLNKASGTVYYTSSNAEMTINGSNTIAGGLVAYNEGKVLSSFTESDLTSSARGTSAKSVALGGLIGVNKGTVDKSYTSTQVTANGEYTYAGGLIGEQLSGSVKDTYVLKNVTATKDHSYAGGYIGRIAGGKVENGYSTAKVTASAGASAGAFAGGFAGRYDSTSKDLLAKLYYVNDADNAINTSLSDFGDGQMRWIQSKPRLDTITLEGLKNRTAFKEQSGWDFEQIWKYGSLQAAFQYPELIRTANSGNGGGSDVNANISWYVTDTGKNEYHLSSEAELAGLAAIVNGTVPGLDAVNFKDRTIILAGPIHIQSSQWVPIGFDEQHAFQGSFDGGDYLIDGLTVLPDHSYSGLFGHIGEHAEISDVLLEPLAVAGKWHTGALAGFNKGTINGATIHFLKGAKVSGGIVGSFVGSNTGTFENVSVTLEDDSRIEGVYPQSIVGGLIGENRSDFTPEMFELTATKGSVGSLENDATVGGVIGKHHADATGFAIDVTAGYTISAEGENSIVGALFGSYESGHGEQLSVTFKDGTLQALGKNSVLGGLIGYSGAGNTLHDVKATSATSIRHLAGDGIVGGIIGSKLGSDSDSFDLEQAVAEHIKITSLASSESAVVGGIAGKLEKTAVHNALSNVSVEAEGERAVAGGVVGHAYDSILYKTKAVPAVVAKAAAQEGIAGGIAGIIESKDAAERDAGHDFGLWAPLYHGIYDAQADTGTVRAAGATAGAADLYAGGIVGHNIHASIYQSGAKANVSVSGGKQASAGGIAGLNEGIIIRTTAQNKVEGDTSAVYNLGGVVGWSIGGNLHYTKQVAPAGASVKAGSAAAVAGTVPTTSIGGFVGKADKTTITYSSSDIPVEVTDTNVDNMIYAGGFVGLLGEDTEAVFKLEHVFSKGKISVRSKTGANVGGFVGSADFYTIADAHAAGEVSVSGNDVRAGGFAGTLEQKAVVKEAIAASAKLDATGLASGDRVYAGGFTGYNDGTVSNSYTDVATINAAPAGTHTFKGSLAGFQFRDGKLQNNRYAATLAPIGSNSGSAADNVQEIIESPLAVGDWDYEYDTYFLSEKHADEVTIATVKQLTGAIRLYNNATGLEYYKLYNRAATDKLDMPKLSVTANLDVTGMRITPFDHFSDVFDGGEHVIKGFKLVVNEDKNVGFFEENDGEIANVSFDQADISGGTSTGFVTGLNKEDGIIRNVSARGALQGEGAIGGIAGINEGAIEEAYARGTLDSATELTEVAAGGIVGVNEEGGTIERSFSFLNIEIGGDEASAGGIAGVNAGSIINSFNSGYVLVDGELRAWAGGIAGYARSGLISGSLNVGEAIAGFDGEITPGSHFFGGVAGQLGQNAVLTGNVYDKQMLKRNTAYYDASGNRIKGADGSATGLHTEVLVNGTLPVGLAADAWQATAGYYPRLAAFDGSSAAYVGSAAVSLNLKDAINRIAYSFILTKSPNLTWTGESGKVAIGSNGNQMIGTLLTSGMAKLTAAFGDERRNIYINDPAWKFKQKAAAPVVVSGDQLFTESVTVELKTDEPGGKIYYTTDGSYPNEESGLYAGPLTFTQTTTLKAITIIDTKEDSEVLTGTWSKPVPSGGVFFPAPAPTPAPAIVAQAGNTSANGTAEAPVKVARNSKLTLTAPAGQIIYYTTDGSTPTKNSPQYKGELLVTGNMTVKAITDKDDRVITIKYEVEKAKFEVKDEASEIKYMTGYKDGTFKPGAAMTRFELIHALSPLLDQEDVALGTLFTDVKASEKDIVAFFASAGIVEGYPNGTFGGEKGLTRAEFTVILSRVLKLDVKTTGQSVLNDVKGHWAEKYINAFTAAGYVKGFPDGSFKPEKEISRAEAVIVINKMIGAGKAKLPASFSDLKPTHWAYEDIMAVTQ